MQAVAQIGIGEAGMHGARVDAHAQVDVAFADLDEVDAGPQLAARWSRGFAVQVDFGGELDQRVGFEPAQSNRKGMTPRQGEKLEEPTPEILFVFASHADACAHCGESPFP